MIAVRHALVSAAIVPALAGDRLALVGVVGTHGNRMLIVVIGVWAVQVPIVQIVNMVAVLHAGVPAICAVDVRVWLVDNASHR